MLRETLRDFIRRGEPDEETIRANLIRRAETLLCQLPKRGQITSEISVKGESISSNLSEPLCLNDHEDLRIGFSSNTGLLAYLNAGEKYIGICYFYDGNISARSNCNGLIDGRSTDYYWELLEKIVKIGEKALRQQKELDGGASSS
ncbi:MAG: hypothetical protein P8Y17_00480 [Patescibacteria group bacterium]|jgi:hypothetical protein